jgi:hypothetical protein
VLARGRWLILGGSGAGTGRNDPAPSRVAGVIWSFLFERFFSGASIVWYRLAADSILLFHLGFVLFVVFGGLVVLRWRRAIWLHVPAATWAVLLQFGGWICPLTPLENHLRRLGGQEGYSGGFIEHYVLYVLYPAGLTREIQLLLGVLVLLVTIGAYSYLAVRIMDRRERCVGAS